MNQLLTAAATAYRQRLAAVGVLHRDSDGVLAWPGDDFDPARVVRAWVLSFNKPVTVTGRDGGEQASTFVRDSVDAWLKVVDPRDVELVYSHGNEGEYEFGTWFRFRSLDSGMVGSFLVHRGELGDQLLDVLDSDPSWGFSFSGFSPDWERTGRRHEVTIETLNIREAGPTDNPSDDDCHVIDIGGHAPRWQRELEGLERHEQLSRMLARRPVIAR
jgi:hypothetical protein